MTIRRPADEGFTLIELLSTLAVVASVVAGSAIVLYDHNRRHLHEELSVSMEENLRIASTLVGDVLRDAGYGVPDTSVESWLPWVAGFDRNPKVASNGLAPDHVSIAACTDEPVARLAAAATPGSTVLLLDDASALDAASRRLIWIGEREHAHVLQRTGNAVTIDTRPTQPKDQGLSRGFVAGTPVCRVDVVTFDLANDPASGVPQLRRDEHRGGGPENLVEGIRDLEIAQLASRHYRVIVRAESPVPSPRGGEVLTRSLGTRVTLANGT